MELTAETAEDVMERPGLRVRQMNRMARNMTPLPSLEVFVSPPEPLQDECPARETLNSLSVLRFGTRSDTFVAYVKLLVVNG